MGKRKQREDLFEIYTGPDNKKVTFEAGPIWYFLVYDDNTLVRRLTPPAQSNMNNPRYKPGVYMSKHIALSHAEEARKYGYSVEVLEVPAEEITYCGKKIIDS